MSNLKISQLPSTTASTRLDYLVKNDSGETTTSKVQLKDVLGFTAGSAANSLQSSKFLTDLGTTANTIGSIAIGAGAEATSDYSIAIGYQALNFNRDNNRQYYIAIGYQAQSITEGVALGKDAQCLATAGFAIGNSTRVYGNGGFALGNSAQSYGNNGIAIGTNSRDNTGLSGLNNGVAIGEAARVDHEAAASIGQGVQSVYSATTHVNSLYSYGQINNGYYDNLSGSTFTIDWNEGNSQKIYMTGNTSLTFTHLRNGAQYRLQVVNGGTHTITAATASGYTILCEGGSIPNITNNGVDMCVLEVMGTDILVRHFADFSAP